MQLVLDLKLCGRGHAVNQGHLPPVPNPDEVSNTQGMLLTSGCSCSDAQRASSETKLGDISYK